MRVFKNFHPAVQFVFFTAVIVVSMFSSNPVISAISAFGGGVMCRFVQGGIIRSVLKFYLPFFVLIAVTNPIFNHNGITPLFFVNGNAFTLEAVLYGVQLALTVTATILWFKAMSEIITSDRLLYLLGSAFPKIGLIVSMTFRFIPLFKKRMHSISIAQKAVGMYSEAGIIDRVKKALGVFTALVSISLESAVETADSMEARGYGTGRRSSYSPYVFHKSDTVFLIFVVIMSVMALFGNMSADYSFYPSCGPLPADYKALMAYVSVFLLVMTPSFIGIKEKITWNYSVSKI